MDKVISVDEPAVYVRFELRAIYCTAT